MQKLYFYNQNAVIKAIRAKVMAVDESVNKYMSRNSTGNFSSV